MATSSIPHRWKYDVFVSFRGEDIRKSFMDHLFKDFKQKEIHAFRDDNELPKGEEISPELYKAIEDSRFLLVIFSKNYASSSWCLRELVKILECQKIRELRHEVRIIFYDVKPNVVRKQTESYAEAFAEHEVLHRTEVPKWKESLSEAANLSGWDLQDMTNGYESKFIDSISKEILKKVCNGPLHVGENLVGVVAYVDNMNLFNFIRPDEVHMIGICGISGIGKTTLAKAIYNKMHPHFEGSCFCEDVQGKGLTQVQMQLLDNILKTRDVHISNISEGIMVIQRISKPILLVLDDVDHRNQLEALAGSPNWFLPGSLIIFTSKDKQLLRSYKVDTFYDMECLGHCQSLELFCLYAFGKKHPTEDLKELTYQIVESLQGHPLALKVLGGSLYHKSTDVWKSQLETLLRHTNKEIQEKLRPSFDGLDFHQKRIFLDIACCFIGEKKDFVASVLDSNDCANANIDVLIDKSLIRISQYDISVQIHGLIRSMAKDIICEDSNIPRKVSRLWIPSEVYDALNENKATEAIEVLVLALEKSSQKVHIDSKAFSHMRNLRILKIYDPELGKFYRPFMFEQLKDFKVNFTGRLEFLSNKISLLCWHGCRSKFLPSDFYPENIVSIDLSYSHIKILWTKPKRFTRLKVMKLMHCRNLTSTPDFTEITNLKELYLDGCVNLVKVHPSIGMLKSLVVLTMRDCKRLKSFQCKLEMDSLQVMDLSGCSKLELRIDGTAITEHPSFVSSMSNLQVLSFGRHERFRSRLWNSSHPSCFPSKLQHPQSLVIPSLAGLCFLRELNFSHCNILQVPNSIGGLSCLEYLYLNGNNFTSLPGSLSQLSHLQSLVLDGCKKLEVLPEPPPRVSYLSARDCISLQEVRRTQLRKDDHSYISYQLSGCPNLFRKSPIESKVCISSQPQDLDTCIASHGFRNIVSSFLEHLCTPSNIIEIFHAQKRIDSVEMVYYGNRINPEWFTNQSMGNHVKVELPHSWCFEKFIGYVTCVVYTPKRPYRSYLPGYSVKNVDGALLMNVRKSFISFSKRDHNIIRRYYRTKQYWAWKNANNFVTFSFKENEDFEVKECGVRLICDEEDMDLVSSMIEDFPTPTIDVGSIDISGQHNIHLTW